MASRNETQESLKTLLRTTRQRVMSAPLFVLDVHKSLFQTQQAIEQSRELIQRSDATVRQFPPEQCEADSEPDGELREP